MRKMLLFRGAKKGEDTGGLWWHPQPWWPLEFANYGLEGGKLYVAEIDEDWLKENEKKGNRNNRSSIELTIPPPKYREATSEEIDKLLKYQWPKKDSRGNYIRDYAGRLESESADVFLQYDHNGKPVMERITKKIFPSYERKSQISVKSSDKKKSLENTLAIMAIISLIGGSLLFSFSVTGRIISVSSGLSTSYFGESLILLSLVLSLFWLFLRKN